MADKGKVIFKETSDMHDDVTKIYEHSCDGETDLAIAAVEELQERLRLFKKNLTQEDE